ncbi:MAG: cache domain-containing protein, partial [Lachnospiraceae bacterium]|nr:cache domain-containing protein [Lachnospiraceae bacterium]
MEKLLRQKTTNLIAIVLLLLGVLAAFAYFSKQNALRETEEAKATICESTILKEYRLEDAFADKIFAIGDLAYIYGQTAKSEEVDRERLMELEVNTHFDYVRFVDKDGINHSSDGLETTVIDRIYYLDGMNGNEGVCFIQNSRINGEDLLGFYTPVYKNEQIIGVLLGLCDLDYVSELLAGVFQGHDAEAFLCSSNGTVIASVYNEFGPNFLNCLSNREHFSEEEEGIIRDALRNWMAATFSYQTELGGTTGYIQPIEVNNWFLVQIYPDEALYDNIYAANQTGFELLYIVLILFVIYVIYLFVSFLMERKALELEGRKSKHISKAMQTILNRFVEIDVECGTYEYLSNSKPFRGEIPEKGAYSVYAAYAVRKLMEEDEKAYLEEHLRLENLKKCFTEDVQYVTYLTHSLWDEERYENLTFVCIERNSLGEAKTLICMRMDVT